jgi:hypothetical protein
MVSAEESSGGSAAWFVGVRSRRALIEPLLAFLACAAFYVSLYGELPYHDVFRFIAQIDSGKYVWDMGHVWLQPVTLLWHQYLGFGESAEQSQKHINTVFAAAGVAVFYVLLLKFEVPLLRRIVATALVAASCNILTLAPTGHMKLLALPFLTASFYYAASWERDLTRDAIARRGDLVRSAVFLALASAFHTSCFAAPPFIGLAILLASLRNGDGWRIGIARAILFGAVCGLLFAALIETASLAFFHQAFGMDSLADKVGEKDSLRTGFFSLKDTVGRMVFGTVNNFVAAPDLGPVLRAWLAHQIPSLRPYADELLLQGAASLATLALIAWLYLRGIYVTARRNAALWMPLAFIAGDLAWNWFFNINEPEHWFHLTVPMVFLFLMLVPRRAMCWALPLWAGITIAMNLALWALPEARYPLKQYQAELARDYGKNDLFLYFLAYGGGPNMSFFDLPTPYLTIDKLYEDNPNDAAFEASMTQGIDAALQRNGRVVVFEALDPMNWNAPWMLLIRDGLTKDKLAGFFARHYRVEPVDDIAGMKAWRILPRDNSRG